jgi:hypothetical protein
MPSINWIESQLEELLEGPWYSSMFYYLNEFRTPTFDKRAKHGDGAAYTPASVARQTAKSIVDSNALVDPVEVGELEGPVKLYRAHDGSSRLVKPGRTSAGTLGSYWFSSELMSNVWASTAGMEEGRNRKSHFRQIMRSCNLVLFEWNAMTQIVCMNVPDGCRVAVVAGTGNWRAMMSTTSSSAAPVKKGFTRQLSSMAQEPTVQYVVPIFNPNWIEPVMESDPAWPLGG